MKTRILLAAAITLFTVPAMAQVQKPVQSMSAQERQALWNNLSDEQKERIIYLRSQRQDRETSETAREKGETSADYDIDISGMPRPLSDMKNPGNAPTYVDLHRESQDSARDSSRPYNR